MLELPKIDRRTARREATKAEIVEAAWELCRAEGLAALSLRDLAARVGMQAPSLYSYFASKNDIYDAMYAQGAQDFVDGMPELSDLPLRQGMRKMARYFVGFCTSDAARYQLLFQRTIPGFEPRPESFAISERGLQPVIDFFKSHGLASPKFLDMNTAIFTGLTDQQISNDPGGDRWTRLVDDAVDMFLLYVGATHQPNKRTRK